MRALARSGALVLILAMTVFAQPGSPEPLVTPPPPVPSLAPVETPPAEQPAQSARRNLFLAPVRVREAQSGRTAQGQAPAAVPSVPLPPPPDLLAPPPLLQSIPSAPAPPQGSQAAEQESASPELVGVLAGTPAQAILRSGADVVVVARGDRTAWGVVEAIRPDAVVLRTPKGRVVLRVSIEGVQGQ